MVAARMRCVELTREEAAGSNIVLEQRKRPGGDTLSAWC
jgi:hypothetical protein